MTEYKVLIDEVYERYISIIEKVNEHQLLYHYTSPAGLIGIIDTKEFWFTDSDFLNDASENTYFCDIFKTIINDKNLEMKYNFWINTFVLSDKYLDNFERVNLTNIRNYDYVASFAIDKDNLSLWNYYTKNPTRIGYNLGIKPKEFISNILVEPYERLIEGKVIYDKQKQKEIIYSMINDYSNIYNLLKHTYQRRYLFKKIRDNLMHFTIFMKSPVFSNENEYRIVLSNSSENKKQFTSFKENMGVFIPFITKKFDTTCIEEIGISPTNRLKFVEDSLVKFALEKELQVKVFLSEIPLRY
jgi:hypothetical protein